MDRFLSRRHDWQPFLSLMNKKDAEDYFEKYREGIQADRKRIIEFKPLASFKLRRDKFQAHFDKEYFFDRGKLHDDAPLTWRDLEQVVQLGKEILNSYSADYDGNMYVIEPINAARMLTIC